MNVCRTRSEYYKDGGKLMFYTWGELVNGFIEPANFPSMEGFPMRAAEDDIRIVSASVMINDKSDAGFVGALTVKTTNPADAEFVFSSEFAEEVSVLLKAGENEICVPCCFAEDGRRRVDLQLTRKSDGVVFKRWYPVTVSYEPIRLALTLPEFRGNFYPGQDYSKVVGKVTANKPVTVTLEGPAISKKTVTPDTDGNFGIDTSDFDYTIGSVHYLKVNGKYYTVDSGKEKFYNLVNECYNGDFYACVEDYFDTVSKVAEKLNPKIIGHFDLITKYNEGYEFFDEKNPRYVSSYKKAIDKLVKYNIPFEINMGGMSKGYKTHAYPSYDILKYIFEKGGKVVLSSDAHTKDTIMYKFEEYEKKVKEIGFEI